MKASVGWAPSTAARRLATSFSTAVRSFQSMGPLHAGRDDRGAALGAGRRLGEVRPVGPRAAPRSGRRSR